jgi:hypothetical protein
MAKYGMGIQQRQFERWFLMLDRSFGNKELSKKNNGRYLLATTQALFIQYCEIENMKLTISSLRQATTEPLNGNG